MTTGMCWCCQSGSITAGSTMLAVGAVRHPGSPRVGDVRPVFTLRSEHLLSAPVQKDVLTYSPVLQNNPSPTLIRCA